MIKNKRWITGILLLCSLFLTACTSTKTTSPVTTPKKAKVINEEDGPPTKQVDISLIPNAVPRYEAFSSCGNPKSYEVDGKRYYVMKTNKNYHATGIASWYGTKFQGRATSSGEPYNMFKMTAAHKTLPIPTYLRVTDLENGRRVIVKVNDRGPFRKNRILDLSYVAARKLGITKNGTGLVKLDAINPKKVSVTSTKPIALPKHEKPEIYLQVGAYTLPANATRLQQETAKTIKDFPVKIYRTRKAEQVFYHVQIGPIKSVSDADKVTLALKEAKLPAPMTVIKEVPVSNGHAV